MSQWTNNRGTGFGELSSSRGAMLVDGRRESAEYGVEADLSRGGHGPDGPTGPTGPNDRPS